MVVGLGLVRVSCAILALLLYGCTFDLSEAGCADCAPTIGILTLPSDPCVARRRQLMENVDEDPTSNVTGSCFTAFHVTGLRLQVPALCQYCMIGQRIQSRRCSPT